MASTKERSWFLILFSLPFAGLGLGLVVFSLLPSLYEWQSMKSWRAVDATLLTATLETFGRNNKIYQATASYSYLFSGKRYSSLRVAINSGGDSDDFQRQLGYRLEQALRRQESITVWVNPDAPREAVIDRSLRVDFLAKRLIFALVFGIAGFAILFFSLVGMDRAIDAAPADKPWRARRAWAGNRIKSSQKSFMWVAIFAAILVNLIAVSLCFSIAHEVKRGNYAALLGGIFPAAGVALLYWAVKLTRDWLKYGEVYLQLDPFPGAIGGHVGGALELPFPHSLQQSFSVRLSCVNMLRVGSGSARQTHEKVVWQGEGVARCEAAIVGTRLKFRFSVPGHLPPCEEISNDYHFWRLSVESKNSEVKFSRLYDIPVYTTHQKSQLVMEDSNDHPEMQKIEAAALASVCNIETIPGGAQLYFPPLRSWRTKLSLVIFACVFLGVGLALNKSGNTPTLLPAVFMLVGSLLLFIGGYGLSNSLSVRLDRKGLWWERKLFGFVVNRNQVAREQIKHLYLADGYYFQRGVKHEQVYTVKAQMKSGKNITVADSLCGQQVAMLMLETLTNLSGVDGKK